MLDHTPKLVEIALLYNWQIIYSALYDIDPDNADLCTLVLPVGFTVWDLYFLQDLMQIENSTTGRLIDIGWYPHADPSGLYRIRVLDIVTKEPMQGGNYNWQSPRLELRCRKVCDLIGLINRSMHF